MARMSARLQKRLVVLLTEMAFAGVETSARQLERLGRPLDRRAWELANLQAAKWAEGWAAQLVRAVTETTRKEIRDILGRAIREGWDTKQIADAIEQRGIFSRDRARRIAITETTRSFAVANALTWRQAGVERGRWMTARDDEVCPICAGMAGKTIPLRPEFGMDTTLPPAHPGCRCYLQPEV